MARRLKVTGFTRFLLVMIILVPLAFVGAALYNGQDPLTEAKKLLGIEQSANKPAPTDRNINQPPRPQNNQPENAGTSNTQNEALQRRLEKLERDNAALQERIKQLDLEIKELKRQR